MVEYERKEFWDPKLKRPDTLNSYWPKNETLKITFRRPDLPPPLTLTRNINGTNKNISLMSNNTWKAMKNNIDHSFSTVKKQRVAEEITTNSSRWQPGIPFQGLKRPTRTHSPTILLSTDDITPDETNPVLGQPSVVISDFHRHLSPAWGKNPADNFTWIYDRPRPAKNQK